ncbi:MAG TPA: threonine--tRNA ligase [Methanocorpusculum sp.]|nr:threonine--tRNA ligase [Methanocorpusculum sp.]HJJ39772.1 threonine--tRNA ligase [Methanocorpusculum sp.]HJJ56575.1 threonine--tRNA ligase [Methanocorpusculum sp.]HJJ95707.1 threonine--tRNA ligase [Methanocorpusculum sp.]
MKVIYNDGKIGECPKDEELHVIRHTAAHILAQAIERLYPDACFAYGPATEKGFYYDVDLGDRKLSDADLPAIEKEMQAIIKENLPIKPFILPRDEAIKLMQERNEPYKVEHISDLAEDVPLSFYQQGDYIDMCVGPHLTYTKTLKAFKLTGISGAYWKNNAANKMLTRINGTAFATSKELEDFLKLQEEAERRDHRKIGKDMKLFMFADEGPGFPFFLPNGMIIKNELLNYWRELHREYGYQEITTPLIMNRHLWETSGHWDHYKENMYGTRIDDEDYCIKPMNCPGGVMVYANEPHSYRELPMRLAEIGTVHRHELKGTLHGLFRVRCFNQDDAHIFMRKDQIAQEIAGVVDIINKIYSKFGFDYFLELSTRPENSMGSDEDWEAATNGLKDALESLKLPYIINEGDGAFYGPKIDFHLRDCIGRTWQCGTIQLDFQMPINFNLTYVDENDERPRPIMIHRVAFGSIERFIGILTEHFAGKFPVWLAPMQAKVLLVSKNAETYAREIYQSLADAKVRVELDDRNEKIGYMIRQAQYTERVPYMIIIGEKEFESNTISVRTRDSKTVTMTKEEFLAKITEEIRTRA